MHIYPVFISCLTFIFYSGVTLGASANLGMAEGGDGGELVMNFVSKFYSKFSPELLEMLQREMKIIGEELKKKATAKAPAVAKESGEQPAGSSGGRQPSKRGETKVSLPTLAKKRKAKEVASPTSAGSVEPAIRRPLVGPESATGKTLLAGETANAQGSSDETTSADEPVAKRDRQHNTVGVEEAYAEVAAKKIGF